MAYISLDGRRVVDRLFYARRALTHERPIVCVGHAVELYLKAAHAKQFGSVENAIKLGHNITRLWKDVRSADPTFMAGYELTLELRDRFLSNDPVRGLSRDELRDYLKHQSLYRVAAMLADLKYLGTPIKSFAGRQMFMTYIYPDDYWIDFFRTLRTSLGHPSVDRIDLIRAHLERTELGSRSRHFLSQLY